MGNKFFDFIFDYISTEHQNQLDEDILYDEFEDFDEWTFPYREFIQELTVKYQLNSFAEKMNFIAEKFTGFFCKTMVEETAYYYSDEFIDSIAGFEDLRKLDQRFSTEFYTDFTDEDILCEIKDEYYDYSAYQNNVFVTDLKLYDKLEPEKNHIPNMMIELLENIKDNLCENLQHENKQELFLNFLREFDVDKILADDILKNYCEENGLMEYYEIIDPNRNPHP